MEGGTTFHFLDAPPAEALDTARQAANGQDVRIGGGPTIIRIFVTAGARRPTCASPWSRTLLGRGERLWDGLEGLENDVDQIEATTAPSGVTHVTVLPARVPEPSRS